MSFEEEDTTEAHERRITRCNEPGCRAQIIFLPTEAGKSMPCNADTVAAVDEIYDRKKHDSHYATCTKPDRFRRSR